LKNITYHFVSYLSIILLVIIGATNYWLYHNTAENLKHSLDADADSKLEGITALSGYYIRHFEFELLENLIATTVTREGVLYAAVRSRDGDVDIGTGEQGSENAYQYSRKIVYGDEYLGMAELELDASQLKQALQQALLESILLVLFTVSLIGILLLLFFRCRVLGAMKISDTEKEMERKEKEFFSVIMDRASSLVIVLEPNGQIVLANNACKPYFSDDLESIKGRFLWEFFPINCGDTSLKDLLKKNNHVSNIKTIACLMNNCVSTTKCDDQKTIIEWTYDVLQDEEAETFRLIVTGVDETVKYREAEKLSHLAMHDLLTGLPNRSLFIDRLKTAIAQYQRNNYGFCLLYLDLDKFKPVNDGMGHEVGDHVLKTISERLLNSLRQVDTVARIGGDEFAIILLDIKSREDAATVAQNCIDVISQPFEYLTHNFQVGVSVGIAYYPEYKCEMQQLINFADMAMYEAKKSGSNKYRFYEQETSDKLKVIK
jgi:diguanylate cyclase (GGDEF)-like protein